ncbi:homocysteine S-methyltransferase family protein [Sulfitobacter sp. HNIBRBA3233]|uniref:homocysteine S-methyltransferase family protein n=1 Tax=Sulfitobacter marinivivus TaxID=3158558 RepID=UPI0032DF1299
MAEITLLDGGMGQELVHRAGDKPTPLWSTQIMIDRPGLVAEVHRDFTQAGATVATVNSYAIHHDRLEGTGMEDSFSDLHAMALEEARTSGAARMAASIGPLGATYRADLHPDSDTAEALFGEIVDLLAPHCDLVLFESIASVAQARDAMRAAKRTDKPVWLAFTVGDADGSVLRSGEPLAEALKSGHPDAVLINCSTPEAIPAGLAVLADTGLPYGAYANGFETITEGFLQDKPTVDALRVRKDFTPENYADHVMAWVDAGATIVGGCCEVSPGHIAEIARRLRAAGHTIV